MIDGWDTLSDTEKANRVARKLLGFPKPEAGTYVMANIGELMRAGGPVVIDSKGSAKKWDGVGFPHGIAMTHMGVGCFGWIQTKS